jgi:DNA polymerase III alpha subunit
VEERKKGAFTSLADFAARVNPRAINKRIIESLAPPAPSTRSNPTAPASLPAPMPFSPPASGHEAATIGQNDMFGNAADARPSCCRRSSLGRRPKNSAVNTMPSASSCPATRSTSTPPC